MEEQPALGWFVLSNRGVASESEQAPKRFPRKAAGINLYVALWQGPTEEQLAELKKAGMPVICEQNGVALKHLDDKTIVGWMHGDEPDNAQALPDNKGYGPPIAPEKIVKDYEKLKAADPSRPVMLNLGQGVAWDGWYGRGEGHSNHPQEYAEYVKGGDIVSFDIYPVAHDHKDVAGKLWLVAFGVERLCKWATNTRQVWNCIECTHIGTPDKKATPAQVKAEVWMSLISGSKGIIYFAHEFKPKFNEHALLDDPEMLAGVTAVNKQIQELAPVLNSPSLKDRSRRHVHAGGSSCRDHGEETQRRDISVRGFDARWAHEGHVSTARESECKRRGARRGPQDRCDGGEVRG